MVALLVDDTINTRQSRAARYVLPITTAQTANTTPVLRDVRRAGKIFSYTVHGAFFFIFEKEWGVQSRTGNRCKTGGRVIPAPTIHPSSKLRRGRCPHRPTKTTVSIGGASRMPRPTAERHSKPPCKIKKGRHRRPFYLYQSLVTTGMTMGLRLVFLKR